ncbi:helix-turn-helix transcriptional regulator [Natrialbaceae archaeon AArc-T1-2]|uniref:helix-turn-helix transcriptional regulator n=1 Tax=Natrialbaceae archaeon AArc-T1-2 TaxID=3053904 RepID=UPI00255ACFAD|nr:helix-turn-helix transcriptional regulator [Natrialbaceae archaeon AArc-T1-2]WIV66183.1 helix-turn-helix transcriptional regulator [Natrialbaceae archaeon AArc-T1-2]
MHDLTGFQRDLLYVIAGSDRPSGQSVKEEVEKYYSSEINHGRLYPNLDTLVNKELVEKGQLDRRTNYYAITDDGRRRIRERREWEEQYMEF